MEATNEEQPETEAVDFQEKSYEVVSLRKPQNVADLGRECIGLHHVFGLDIIKKGNMHLIEDDRIVYALSNAIVFQDVVTGAKEFLKNIDDGGIGCIALHPSKKMFAVGAKGFQPKIYIYSYPELKVMRVLSGGAEKGYACMAFCAEGDKLASVSTSPDFMLTIWDWETEAMGLHSKAFGQDIFNVQFSADDSRRLTTSGIGHIRFWKMAATFTGLKLQGHIGKFGKIDLSDIEHFIELPDGKVVSGTETGSLLLWEGNFIKCRFIQVGGRACHDSSITYVSLDRKEKCLISASSDGYIRWWDYTAIDAAEVDSDVTMDFELLPLAEFFIGTGLGVKTLLDSGTMGSKRFFVILDTSGNLQTITFAAVPKENKDDTEIEAEEELKLCDLVMHMRESIQNKKDALKNDKDFVLDEQEKYVIDKNTFEQFHSSAVTGVDTCPVDHLAATCALDGTVRCIDYVNRKVIASVQFSCAATCLRWLPTTLDSTGRLMAVGFADGVIRILSLSSSQDKTSTHPFTFMRQMAFKPHNAAVTEISFNEGAELLATGGKDGIIFFLQCKPIMDSNVTWTPLRFVTISAMNSTTGKAPVTCERISWSPNGTSILCVCNDGSLKEVDLKKLDEILFMLQEGEAIQSYEEYFPIRDVPVKVPVLTNNRSSSMSILPTSLAKADISHDNLEAAGEAGDGENNNGAPSVPSSPTKPSTAASIPYEPALNAMVNLKISQATYSVNRLSGGLITGASLGQKSYLLECDMTGEKPVKELANGVYSQDGKESLKNPAATALRYTWSKQYLLVGTADGSVILRPSSYLEIFIRTAAHNSAGDGVAHVAASYDDRFILSIGRDGTLIVNRVRHDILTEKGVNLYKDVTAGVFANEPFKPASKIPTLEPNYLTFVSTIKELPEMELFAAALSGKKPLGLAAKPLGRVLEQNDVAPGAYSIQDNRLKLEEDAKKVSADELKNRIRASIRSLQKDYEKIQKENETIPDNVRLTLDELLVDKEYFEILASQGLAMIDEVHKECAYEAEKSEKLVLRLKERMMNGLLMEEMSLGGFSKREGRQIKSIVKSLRTKALDAYVKEVLKEVQNMMRQAELKEAEARANETAYRKALEAVDEMKTRLNQKGDGSGGEVLHKIEGGGQTQAVINQQITLPDHGESESTADIRRVKRKERKDAIKKHQNEKPNEDEDDIRDLNSIKIAEKTIGDFKLKCADDYEVPEDQRINALKKMRQMAMLEESMITMRLQFNERFLSLRQLKRDMTYAIRRDNKRIRAIDEELKQSYLSQALWEPKFDPDEFPDDADEVTEQELTQYQASRSKSSWEKAQPPKHNVITGSKTSIVKNFATGSYEAKVRPATAGQDNPLEGFLSDSTLIDFTPEREEGPKYYEVNDNVLSNYITSNTNVSDVSSKEYQALAHLEDVVPVLSLIKEGVKSRTHAKKLTAQQEIIHAEYISKLQFERRMILQKLDENTNAFNEAIEELRTDRHTITADLKLAELKLLVLCQEYRLLQTFESRDNALQQKQIRCKGEETEIVNLSQENRAKLETKQEEIQHWNEKLAQIQSEFKTLLPENHPYAETLNKIFKKKVKRNKGGEDGEGGEEDDYDDHDDGDNEDEDDDDEEVEDICPPGCDQAFFERILDLREKKLDTEEFTVEIQKGIDDLKKTIDRLRQREKQIVKDAAQTEIEVQQFQLQKQAALNQISVVVPIRISQLYMFEQSGKLTGPTDKPITLSSEEEEQLAVDLDILRNPEKRNLVSNVELKSHTLFTNKNLIRLKNRIGELHSEIDGAKEDFKQLHKERGVLIREREANAQDIELWSARCRDLQMLKFGREIDLDELEASTDRNKEKEQEAQLKEEEEKFRIKAAKLAKEAATLQEALQQVTAKNTKLLNDVAELTESRLMIARELNTPAQVVTQASKLDNFREMEENRRIAAYVQFQAKELESLRAELNMLKRKEAPPVMSQTVPLPPANQMNNNINNKVLNNNNNQKSSGEQLVLPPIPINKR